MVFGRVGILQKEDKEALSPVVDTERTGKVGCPLNLNCFHDFNEARNYAKSINKPVMIDFTGFSCVNCRKMEENVWADSRVLSVIKNDYVLVSLYVDDPTELPDSMKSVSRSTGEKIDTYGEKWSDMETASFSSNSQPLYVLLDDNGNELTMPKGYTPDIEQYLLFLEQGKSNFHNLRVGCKLSHLTKALREVFGKKNLCFQSSLQDYFSALLQSFFQRAMGGVITISL